LTKSAARDASVVQTRVSSGYDRLDAVLQGGFLAGSAIVLTAPACDEVPLLLRNFLRGGQKGSLLVSRTVNSSQLISHDLPDRVKSLVCSDKIASIAQNVIPGKGIENLTELNLQISEVIEFIQPERLALDILSDVLLRHKALLTRKWLTELLERLRSRGVTTLATTNPYMHSSEEVQAVVDLFDGGLEIIERETENEPTRVLRIKWMHGIQTAQADMPLIDVNPDLKAPKTAVGTQSFPTSIAGRTGRMPTAGGATTIGTTVLGTVLSVWRYPVKSMIGEELNAADVTDRGVLGDRVYAVFDRSSGKVASAKNPLKWAKLFDCRAVFIDPPVLGSPMPPVRINLPDGSFVNSDESELESQLAQVFGREVRFESAAPEESSLEEYWPDIDGLAHREMVTDEQMPPRSFFDFGLIHLMTTNTLNRLRVLYPQGRFEVRRFRPNIVVDSTTAASDFPENTWIGRTLSIGDHVQLRVVAPCPRCVMTTLPQGDLPRDPGILRTAALHTPRIEAQGFGVLSANVGVYADVLSSGRIRRGDLLKMS
jgi:uncharacterized protein YcbX